ncbi:hypothetical protein GCM10025856_23590 [Methylophaga marina]|uniref:Glycosyl transferase family 1 domain-containing protein n=1 Tax=Methylophaga marina TaxID=45495 RepID=A0ABP3D6U0_9GAMM|nr:glycosyltransferase family 4 protein [Methylophaga marina]BDZ74640.1 hypothetical protein GCM10025856_23590 [Methylophaga marina]
MKKIYYLIPDIKVRRKWSFIAALKSIFKGQLFQYTSSCFTKKEKPVGGIKVIYQHCQMLNELGYDAYPLMMGDYSGNFFDYNNEIKTFVNEKENIKKGDVVVATEFEPYEGLVFRDALKVIFVQNWWGVIKRLKPEDRHLDYIQLGYDHVFTCSQYCSEYVSEKMNIPAATITNGIDLDVFCESNIQRIPNRVLAMSRKNPADLEQLKKLLSTADIELHVVDGLSQSELVLEYQSAEIFVTLGYPEGFSLPPLEAMACGCVVIGFTGGGANEFMINEHTALVSKDGDCESVYKNIIRIQKDYGLKERLRRNGLEMASNYDLKNTKKQLSEYYEMIIGKPATLTPVATEISNEP